MGNYSSDWLIEAAEELRRHAHRKDAADVAGSLDNGLTILRDCLYRRVHQDVERVMGVDSMLVPVSETKTLYLTNEQIEAYQIAESAAAVRQFGYVSEPGDWYLTWLARLRLGQRGSDAKFLERSAAYLSQTPDDRRLTFTNMLARVLPESRRAPLVLFRLVPLSVQIATALAFADQGTVADLRCQQAAILPGVANCRECQGRVLPCAEQCRACGNPLWKFEWLAAVD